MLWLLYGLCGSLYGFTPPVSHYSSEEFGAANQNWAVGQDSRNVLYFANRDGLLEFNGLEWFFYQLPSHAQIRSLYIDGDDRVYIGAFGEFGYFERDRFGKLNYTCLSVGSEDNDLRNQQIINIAGYEGKVWFQRYNRISIYDPQNGSVTIDNQRHTFLSRIEDTLYGFIRNVGLVSLGKDTTVLLVPADRLQGDEYIRMATPFDGESLLMLGNKGGVYRYYTQTRVFERWTYETAGPDRRTDINRIAVVRDSLVVAGTTGDGVFVLDKRGRLLWQLNSENGLQNNTVLNLFCDREDNIWLALNKGIDLVRLGSTIRTLSPFEPNVGSVYDVAEIAPYRYLGTNHGLFRMPLHEPDNRRVEAVPGIDAYVNSFFVDGKRLLVNHPAHTYSIVNGKIESVITSGMGRFMQEFKDRDRDLLVQSTNRSLKIYTRDASGNWRYSHLFNDYRENIGNFVVDGYGTIWAAHYNTGFARLYPDRDWRRIERVVTYADSTELASRKVGIYLVQNRVVLSDGVSCYVYDEALDEVVPYGYLNDHIGRLAQVRYIVRVSGSLYWFMTRHEAALLDLQPVAPRIVKVVPFKPNGIAILEGYEKIVPVSEAYSYICVDNGLVRVTNTADPERVRTGKILVYEASGSDRNRNTVCYPVDGEVRIRAAYSSNSLTFRFGFPEYSEAGSVRFRYVLEGFDDPGTVPLSASAEVSYVRLPHGTYRLLVEAVDPAGVVLDTLSIPIEIAVPFHRSAAAFLLYVLGGLGVCLLLILWARRKEVKRQRAVVEAQEKEIVQLENARLNDQVKFKSKELARSAMEVIQKNEMLSAVKKELLERRKKAGSLTDGDISRIIQAIENSMASGANWEVFQANFDMIHEGFFRNLHATFPQLTPNDLKICALLRLNLSTKEVANFLNISPRGVEISRYRLRKKLGLTPKDDLVAFLIDFQ